MKCRSVCLSFAIAMCVAVSVSSAVAQPGGGGRGFGRGFGQTDPSFLLGQESVQKELELSADQKSAVAKMTEATSEKMRDIFQSGGDFEENRKKMAEVTAANKKKVAEILAPPQTSRLDEIALQYGLSTSVPSTLASDPTAEKLGLTAEQKEKLNTVAQDGFAKTGEIFQGGGDRQERQEKMAKLREEQKTAAMAVLNDEQKAKLDKLQGKKFDVASIQFQFGGQRRGNN